MLTIFISRKRITNAINIRAFARNLHIGQEYQESFLISPKIVNNFIELSGDNNILHTQRASNFKNPIVHGALLNCYISRILGTKLPGPGTVVVKQELNFPAPCYVNDIVEFSVIVRTVRKIITIDFECKTRDTTVLRGYANVIVQKF